MRNSSFAKNSLVQLIRQALVPAAALGLLAVSGAQAQTVGDVFVIDMENHNFTQPAGQTSPQPLAGNPAAPYLNSLITPGSPNAAQTSYATAYHNVLATPSGNNPDIHPSEPNYIWQEGGSNFGVLNDNTPYANNGANVQSAPNLSGLLQSSGQSWKSYQEDIDLTTSTSGKLTSVVAPQSQWTVPLNNFSGTSSAYINPYNGSNQYNFAAKHDGQLFYTATNGGNDTTPSNPEVSHYDPLQQLSSDLSSNAVGKYNLITPDQYNDAHTALTGGFTYNGTHYTGDSANIAQGDNFLSQIIPEIQASAAYKNNGAIFIWWDETEGVAPNEDDYSHTLSETLISPLAKGNAYDSTLNYSHSSDLKTLQEIFGVPAPGGGFLGDAASPSTNDLSDLFKTGSVPQAVPEASTTVSFGLLLALGLGGAFVAARKKKSA